MGPAEKLAALDAVCDALAHPARRQILMAVAVCGGSLNAGYREPLGLLVAHRQPPFAGARGGGAAKIPERRGRERHYRLNTDAVGVLDDWLSWLRVKPAPGGTDDNNV